MKEGESLNIMSSLVSNHRVKDACEFEEGGKYYEVKNLDVVFNMWDVIYIPFLSIVFNESICHNIKKESGYDKRCIDI